MFIGLNTHPIGGPGAGPLHHDGHWCAQGGAGGVEVSLTKYKYLQLYFWQVLEERSKEILDMCDVDGDGEISKEEFIKHSLTCDFICDMIQIMDNEDEEDF